MTTRRRPREIPYGFAFRLTAALLLAVVGDSHAALRLTTQTAGGEFGPSARNEKHPKSALVRMTVADGTAPTRDGERLCAGYRRFSEVRPDKGNLSARVEVRRDGERLTVVEIPKVGVLAGSARSCAAEPVSLLEGDVLDWRFQFKGMPKIPGGDQVTFQAEVLAPDAAFGSFRIGGAESFAPYWIDGSNLIFCRTEAGFADLWVRLAAERGADGGNGPHIDIDVCNHAGGGSFSPHDPQNPTCGADRTFDIFWHDESGGVWANEAQAARCRLDLVDAGATLDGTFACAALRSLDGASPVDVFGGSFRCSVD